MIAWQQELDDRCPGCGTQSYEDGMYQAVAVHCLTCSSIGRKRAKEHDQKPPVNPGSRIMLKRRR